MIKFTDAEVEKIYQLTEQLTGTCQSGRYRREILVSNIERRMRALSIPSLDEYIELASRPGKEHQELLSSLTIHTTSWFREEPHYAILLKKIEEFYKAKHPRPFRLWSSACSTGEEVYSSALILEKFRLSHPGFEYEVRGSDIDPVSVRAAERAIYYREGFASIPLPYQGLVLMGSGKTSGLFTLDPEIRKRTRFYCGNLTALDPSIEKQDWIFCRNVLIYFEEKKVVEITHNLFQYLSPQGILCLGHSEAFNQVPSGFHAFGKACYGHAPKVITTKKDQSLVESKVQAQIESSMKRVLIIDDSAIVRRVLRKLFERRKWIVTESANAMEADQMIASQGFELITLDLHMEPIDGAMWLRAYREKRGKAPVVIVSDADPKEAQEVFGALESGAQDYIIKTALNQAPEEFLDRVEGFLKTKVEDRVTKLSAVPSIMHVDLKELKAPEVILIGASTGGPEALSHLLGQSFNAQTPPILVVQHINESFAKPFAERLATVSGLKLMEPVEGEVLEPGRIYLSFGNYHISVKKDSIGLRLVKSDAEKILGHRPSVDFLFREASKFKINAWAFLLTGMGKDGAAGMMELKQRTGSINFAQEESSCVVFGMPKEALGLGAAHFQGNIEQFKALLLKIPTLQGIAKAA